MKTTGKQSHQRTSLIWYKLLQKALNLQKQVIDLDLLGSHSLHARGDMALKLHGAENTTIENMWQWTSLTFLQYIHNQIAHLYKDMSKTMSMPLPFLNIADIEGTASWAHNHNNAVQYGPVVISQIST